MAKYELLEIEEGDFKGFYRIKALVSSKSFKKEEVGGIVASKDSLSQEGECWLRKDSFILDNAKVSGDILIEKSSIKGDAIINGNGRINSSLIKDKAYLKGNFLILSAYILGNSIIEGDVKISFSNIENNAIVRSLTQHNVNDVNDFKIIIEGFSLIKNNAKIEGDNITISYSSVENQAIINGNTILNTSKLKENTRIEETNFKKKIQYSNIVGAIVKEDVTDGFLVGPALILSPVYGKDDIIFLDIKIDNKVHYMTYNKKYDMWALDIKHLFEGTFRSKELLKKLKEKDMLPKKVRENFIYNIRRGFRANLEYNGFIKGIFKMIF